MRKSRILGLLLAFCVLISCSFAQASEVRTISVNGTSNLKVAPDKATVNISIETVAKDAKEASAQNAIVMNKIQKNVMALAIPRDKIKTTNYSLSPVYDYNNGKQKITGYRVSNEILVTVDNIEVVGNVIDTSINAGANNINSVEFGLKDSEAQKDKALQQAIFDAKRKAQSIAAALGKSVVNVQSVSANDSYIQFRTMNNALYAAKVGGVEDSSSPIQAGDINIKANVSVVFEMD